MVDDLFVPFEDLHEVVFLGIVDIFGRSLIVFGRDIMQVVLDDLLHLA